MNKANLLWKYATVSFKKKSTGENLSRVHKFTELQYVRVSQTSNANSETSMWDIKSFFKLDILQFNDWRGKLRHSNGNASEFKRCKCKSHCPGCGFESWQDLTSLVWIFLLLWGWRWCSVTEWVSRSLVWSISVIKYD